MLMLKPTLNPKPSKSVLQQTGHPNVDTIKLGFLGGLPRKGLQVIIVVIVALVIVLIKVIVRIMIVAIIIVKVIVIVIVIVIVAIVVIIVIPETYCKAYGKSWGSLALGSFYQLLLHLEMMKHDGFPKLGVLFWESR